MVMSYFANYRGSDASRSALVGTVRKRVADVGRVSYVTSPFRYITTALGILVTPLRIALYCYA